MIYRYTSYTTTFKCYPAVWRRRWWSGSIGMGSCSRPVGWVALDMPRGSLARPRSWVLGPESVGPYAGWGLLPSVPVQVERCLSPRRPLGGFCILLWRILISPPFNLSTSLLWPAAANVTVPYCLPCTAWTRQACRKTGDGNINLNTTHALGHVHMSMIMALSLTHAPIRDPSQVMWLAGSARIPDCVAQEPP